MIQRPSVSPATACGRWRKCAVRTICAVDGGMLVAEMSSRPAEASLDGELTQHKLQLTTGWHRILSHSEPPKDRWDVTLLYKPSGLTSRGMWTAGADSMFPSPVLKRHEHIHLNPELSS